MYDKLHKLTAAASAAAIMLTGTFPMVHAEETDAPLRLMCLGDSITDGFWLPGGYRNTLCALITEHDQESRIDMVGQNWGGTGYDPQHAGYSGYSIDNIAQEDSISGQRTGISSFADWLMETYPADVVFLQIGTNDILSLYDLEHFGDRLEGLVDTVLNTLPADGMLYLATLPVMDATNTLYISEYFFTVESMDAAVDQCNEQIRALAAKLQTEGRPVQLAEINHVLTKEDLYDGVHPNEKGYQKMGEFWYERLTEYLNGEVTLPEQTETVPAETTETAAAETTLPEPDETTAESTSELIGTAAESTATETETETVTETETEASETAPESSAFLRGDVDGNGTVQIADAVLLTQHLAAVKVLTAEQAVRADLDANNLLNAADLSLLKQAL